MKKVESTRQRLLDAGMQIAKQQGIRGITIRGVTKSAGINLGSFVYHFKQRDLFVNEIVENWYAPLFQQLQIKQQSGATPLDDLINIVNHMIEFLLNNREFISQLFLDGVLGEKSVQEFSKKMIPRHIKIVLVAIERAIAAKQICQAPALQQFIFIVSSIGVPVVLQQVMFQPFNAQKIEPNELDVIRQQFIDFAIQPELVKQRCLWVFKGLAYSGE